jgi:hypothetical protein
MALTAAIMQILLYLNLRGSIFLSPKINRRDRIIFHSPLNPWVAIVVDYMRNLKAHYCLRRVGKGKKTWSLIAIMKLEDKHV